MFDVQRWTFDVRLPFLVSALLASAAPLRAADSVVVFNEIHYHPATNETASEWVELHNQMAVDIDLSAWSLGGGLGYVFPEGTIIPGGGYLVVALNPGTVKAATGRTNIVGPFTGRLSNAGDRLVLRDRNNRTMDEMTFDVENDWPVAPDGFGLTLAKLDENLPSDAAANWGASAQIGGTPGVRNTWPTASTPLSGVSFNEISTVTNREFWLELFNRGQTAASLANCVLARVGTTNRTYTFPALSIPAGAFAVVTRDMVGFGADPGDRIVLYAPGKTNVVDAMIAKSFPRARWPDGTGDWLHPNPTTPGNSNHFVFEQDVVINEIMYHHMPQLDVFPESTTGLVPTNQLIFLTNTWRYEQSGADLGTAWRLPGYDDSAWPVGRGLFYASTNLLQAPKNTPLTLGPPTYYFRTTFVTNGKLPESIMLRHIIDDGAVVYLNGTELTRYRMPSGEVGFFTRASSGIGIPALVSSTNLPAAALVPGTNVLAVEVHQAINPGDDVVFGLELSATGGGVLVSSYEESEEEWIELFNRGANTVNLGNWRLDDAVEFRFTPNTTIPPGGYLVVARDPAALQASYPQIAVVGPYTNRLSHSTDRILLRDAVGNPADQVVYFDGGRWPDEADGGGSSLELRNPFADNAVAEAWAPSDESPKNSWRTYTYRRVAAASAVGRDDLWNEFVIALLGPGEVLVDNLRVIDVSASSPVQLLQNGTFESGTNKWRIMGNHHGEVIPDPDQPGNHVLRLVAAGAAEHMSNHGETTLTNNIAVVNGDTYEISFRAKWIRGCRQFLTRLYFNRAARTTVLDASVLNGTPGARNSTYSATLGPTYAEFRHDPPVPNPSAPVTVSVQTYDPDGIAAMQLWSRRDGGNWSYVPMTALPQATARPNYTLYTGTLPGWAAGTVVQFYVDGQDNFGAHSAFPAAGPASHALLQVNDNHAATNGLHNVRLIMLTNDVNVLLAPLNVMSEDHLGGTLISDEHDIYYEIGVGLKGSEASRTTPSRVGFNVTFGADQPFRGIHKTVAIDRSQGGGSGQREMLVNQTMNHGGGLPTKYHDLIQVLAPRAEQTGTAELQLGRYSKVFIGDQFADGDEGMLFEYEIVYLLTTTDTGQPEGTKVPIGSDGWVGSVLRDLGDDKENYRWTFLLKNNPARDDYSRIMTFAKAWSLSGNAFISAITNIIDVDQYLRAFAVAILSGTSDTYGSIGDVHNAQFYVRPEDNRILFFPHDLDLFVGPTAIVVHNDISKLMSFPAHARMYYRHLRDLIATTCNSTYMAHWTANYGRLLPAQDFASYLPFFDARATYVLGQVNSAVPQVTFAITSNNGSNFSSTSNHVTIEGNGWLDVAALEVNGVPYAVNWTGVSHWAITVPLVSGANVLNIQGVTDAGTRPVALADSITVTNTGASALQPVVINEWMADNAGPDGFPDPADQLFQDWFELYNPNEVAVNLGGYHLTDDFANPTQWTIPANTIIPAHGFRLVWVDENGSQNGTGTNGDLHANFKLSAGGEKIGLFAPGGVTPQHLVVFGVQYQNVSQGLYPDGNTNDVRFMTRFTPRAPNILPPLQVSELSIVANQLILSWETQPGQTYRVEYKNDLADPTWTVLPGNIVPAGFSASVTNAMTGTQRFYRVVWSQ